MSEAAQNASDVAEDYYDSDSADSFYREIWGGEDIHIGLYDGVGRPPIREASAKTVEKMADMLPHLGPQHQLIDIGAGYGGTARHFAERYGCTVICLNISETQNAYNRECNQQRGLSDKVIVKHGSFEDIPEADNSFEGVLSQDAILHSGNRPKVLQEVDRVIKPGGDFLFTDPMQADDCPDGVLDPILNRIHLDTMGSVAFYRSALKDHGFQEIEVIECPEMLRAHYASVAQALRDHYTEMVGKAGQDYVDRMLKGLQHWVDGADQGYLNWGFLHFRKNG